MKEEQVRSM